MNGIEETSIVFHFCGQGVQWKTMALSLYNENSIFRNSMNRIDNYLKENYFNGESMLNKLRSLKDDGKKDDDQFLIHSILFMFQVSIFEIFKSEGIYPSFIIGISCGEMASLYCSGALSLKSVCDLLYERAKLMDKVVKINPFGIPFFIRMGNEEFIEKYSKRYPDIEICAIFSDDSLLLGTCNNDQFENFSQEIKEKGILRRIPSTISFHSSAMDCVKEDALKIKDIEFKNSNSTIPVYCSYTGKLYKESNSFNIFKSIRDCIQIKKIYQDFLKSLESNGTKKLILVEISPHPNPLQILLQNVKSLKSNVFKMVSTDDSNEKIIYLSSLNKNNDDNIHINNVIETIKNFAKIKK
ncbi:hypothetical protein RB653_001136 [Dictyostelium firmibasis]|uniref:Malonyl-CoA:ACP transacylase (MAT) domain-containing protein n=1 Tax=Dictyostelium firmibasis TaxID=79012 RepID=A0AAN7U3Q9_9MYCE